MLAGCQGGHADLGMDGRNCKIQDAVDAVIGDDVLGARHLRDVILHGLPVALLKIKAATGGDADVRE